jgi:hypothetical protein
MAGTTEPPPGGLAGHFDGGRLLASLGILLIFLGLLTMLSRSVRRWEERLH